MNNMSNVYKVKIIYKDGTIFLLHCSSLRLYLGDLDKNILESDEILFLDDRAVFFERGMKIYVDGVILNYE